MKSFFRENPTIAFGLGLPLLLVIVFLLISGIPSLVVAPPQHEVLYATEYYNYQNRLQISVIDKKVQVTYQVNGYNSQKPRIWRYNPKTGAVKEISFILPPSLQQEKNQGRDSEAALVNIIIDVPDLKDLSIDSSSIAQDGYEFSIDNNRYSGNAFGSLFYSSRYRHEAVLTKNGRSIRLPNVIGRHYSNNTYFIGWVVSP